MEMDTESLVQLVKSIDTINSRLQVLESSKFNAHLTEEKLLQLESFAGVINRKVDNIERYRDYKEERYEKIKEKIAVVNAHVDNHVLFKMLKKEDLLDRKTLQKYVNNYFGYRSKLNSNLHYDRYHLLKMKLTG